MNLRLYLRLAWRNIWRHRRRTLIVVLAIGLGMALMMFYDGMIAGFEQAIYGNAIKCWAATSRSTPPGITTRRNRPRCCRCPTTRPS